jgi:hypothetical protein
VAVEAYHPIEEIIQYSSSSGRTVARSLNSMSRNIVLRGEGRGLLGKIEQCTWPLLKYLPTAHL